MEPIEQLIRMIESEVRETSKMIGRDRLNERVMQALRDTPRHEFVAATDQYAAYENHPLSIGFGQTISQPYIVALMTDLLEPQPDHSVLEVGTGSGYQAAVLSQLVARVYSVERVEQLAQASRERLRRLGYNNVEVRCGDGYFGWPEHAPFDGIIVTAAAPHVPTPLVEQLKPGGKLVIPVGGPFFGQQLLRIGKDEQGNAYRREVLGVAFVPLTGEAHHQPAELDPN